MYTKLIETILNRLGREYVNQGDKISCQNPFQWKEGGDKKRSARWFTDSGGLAIWNMTVNGKKWFPIHEACKLLECTNEYIKFICDKHNITVNQLGRYVHKYKLQDIEINEEEIIKVELLSDCSQPVDVGKYFVKEVSMNQYEYNKCLDYLNSRRLKVIPNTFEPCKIIEGSVYENSSNNWHESKLTIVSRYRCGYNKYRFIDNNNRRFTSTPKCNPKDFMWVRKNNTDHIYVIEGNSEGVTVSYYVDDDIAVMGSATNLPSDLNSLKEYKSITLLIDQDKYHEDKKYLSNYLKKHNIDNFKIRMKTEIYYNGKFTDKLKAYDFNHIHKHQSLDRETIETGYLNEKVFVGKEGFENNMSWQQFLLHNN